MSAWGASWGASWGNAWGSIVVGCGYDNGNTYDNIYEYDAASCPLPIAAGGEWLIRYRRRCRR